MISHGHWKWPFLPNYSFLGGKCCKTSSLAVEWRFRALNCFVKHAKKKSCKHIKEFLKLVSCILKYGSKCCLTCVEHKHIDIILKYWEIWHAVTLKTNTDSFWFQISKAGVQAGEVSLCILHKPNKKKLVFLSSDFYKYHIEDAGNHPKQALRQS